MITDFHSEMYAFQPNAILIFMSVEKLYEAFLRLPDDKRAGFADNTAALITEYWAMIGTNLSVPIIQYNFALMDDAVFGNYAFKAASSFPFQLQKLNDLLSESASSRKNIFLVNLNGVQNRMGRNAFYDEKLYYIARMPISLEALPDLASITLDTVQALRGHVKKCVIADLDNTLWGGVIGDDGLNGIQLDELGNGRAFTALQHWLKSLKERGILIAICSKNNEETAKEPFLRHPDMVLRLEDIAMFVANWEDKAGNILRIQQTLNIGMDSLVFLDDNPFERNLVRTAIPEITVPELPEDPALYLDYLRALNLFETASYSATDSNRTQQYQKEAERSSAVSAFGDYGEYLQSLDMRAIAAPFNAFQYPRIAQLTQRSNQFNLRTIRYTEAQVEAIAEDENHITRYYTLRDSYGDYGLISVVILDKHPGGDLFISEWLMSCRVLKRGMEEFIINDMIATAKTHGFRRVIGEYIKTPKNAMVADIYGRMGFRLDGTLFYADVATFSYHKTYITEETV